MLDDGDEGDRAYQDDGAPVKVRSGDVGQANPRGVLDTGEVDETKDEGDDIAGDDGKKHRNRAEKPSSAREDHGRHKGNPGDDGTDAIEDATAVGGGGLEGHLHRGGGEADADDDHGT